ncbi:hypothetical protein FGO68_gene3541 [Halteria grandinella]|uniref:Uncharacterized protein n=1 Tax=Halteria grandinella TaxID=5974 RepID=A0A8J8T667_HALGN|nr:hypothetical protein FGO68_gene3541 [Halteria grandinella]
MDKCTFYLQYLEEPDMPNVFRLHSFNKYHTHHCKRRIVWNMSDYYQRKQSLITHEPRSFDRNSKRDWRTEFMKSLTYELTTVYAEQIVQSIQQKTDKEAREAIQQMSDDMDNRNHKRALMGRIRRGERGGDKILEKVQGKGYGMRELPAPGSTKQIVRDLNIDKELYFERHINKYGMEQKL